MIDRARRLIFLHVPKCAGISIEQAMGGLPADQRHTQHWGAPLMARHFPEDWRTCRIFTVVRHPVDRAVSYVRFLRRYDPIWRHRLGAADDHDLLLDLLQGHDLLTAATPHRMIPDPPPGGAEITVLQMERLAEAWPDLAARHDLPPLPGLNRAPAPAPAAPAWLRLCVEAAFPECFDRFGYPRDPTPLSELPPPAQGRVLWTRLHAWAWRQAGSDPAQIEARQGWLGRWVMSLPEDAWAERWGDLVVERPPPLDQPDRLPGWAEDIHEDVRAALGQPPWRPWRP